MRIDPAVYLVASGRLGFDLTDAYDCNVYLFDSQQGHVLFDAGAGLGTDQLLDVCRADGLSPDDIVTIYLSHGHADHSGGAAALRERTGAIVRASSRTAQMVSQADTDAISLSCARAAGVYPADYKYRGCPVDVIEDGGQAERHGSLEIETIASPGHSHDHTCYLVTVGNKRYLISGDAVFFGGKIALQNTYDCSVPESITTLQLLAQRDFDALLPGHLLFSVKHGKRHVDEACAVASRLGCPSSIV